MAASAFEAPLETAADWAVLADWLAERGDPRGAWLQLEQHTATLDEGPARARLEARLVGEFAPIGTAQVDALTREIGKGARAWLSWDWRCGLLTGVRASPGLDILDSLIAKTLTTLLDSSAALALADLHLGDVAPAIARKALLAGPPRPSLSRLTFGNFREPVGKLAPLAAKLPNLRELELRGPGIDLADTRLPALHTLRLHGEEALDEAILELGRGAFTKLRALDLRLGGRRYASSPAPEALLAGLLAGAATPELRHLGLSAVEFADPMVQWIADSALLPRLSTLDLSDSWLTNQGAETLLARADRFEHLEQIELSACHVDEDHELALVERFGERVTLGLQVHGMRWDPETRAFIREADDD